MFQRRMEPLTTASRRNDWAVYIRLQGGDLAEFQTIATNIPPYMR
jgi:hypothetical protein